MPISAAAFVRAVIDQLELPDNPRQPARHPQYRGASALASILGVSYGSVKRWLDSEREPGYQPTMEMLTRCGWLRIPTERLSAEELTAWERELTANLEAVRLQRQAAEAAPAPRKAARR